MLSHRRKLHPRTRVKLDEDWSDLQILANQSVTNILKEDENDSEFLCVTIDGSLEWMELADDFPAVQSFRDRQRNVDDSDLMRIDAQVWAKGLLVQ